VRNALHVIIAVLLWLLFGYYWYVVMQQPMNPDTKTALVSLGVLSFLTILCLSGWVFHNIRIARQFPRRKVRRAGGREPVQDFLGRWIIVDEPDAIVDANYIEVEVRSTSVEGKVVEEKIFRTTRKAT